MQKTTTNVLPENLNYDQYENEIYDTDIVLSIPGHNQLHKSLEKCLRKHLKTHTVSSLLDLGIGTGLTAQKVLSLIPSATLIGIDFSETMLAGAKKRLAQYQFQPILGDYASISLPKNTDVILSVIGMHHQTHAGKKKMFRKIYSSLNPGGLFLFGDLVTYRDRYKAGLCEAKHFHFLVENARNEQSLAEWVHHHKFLNLLAPVEDQMERLKQAGFSSVVLEYERFNTALIVAKK